jgi:hypothetical protein
MICSVSPLYQLKPACFLLISQQHQTFLLPVETHCGVIACLEQTGQLCYSLLM